MAVCFLWGRNWIARYCLYGFRHKRLVIYLSPNRTSFDSDSPCEICSRKSEYGRGFSLSTSGLPFLFIPLTPSTHLHLNTPTVRRGNKWSVGTFEESNALSVSREHRILFLLCCFERRSYIRLRAILKLGQAVFLPCTFWFFRHLSFYHSMLCVGLYVVRNWPKSHKILWLVTTFFDW